MATAILNEPVVVGNNALSVESLPSIVYRDQPVITTRALADLYGTDQVNIRKNLSANKDRFRAGKHFFRVEGEELRAFRACVTESNACFIPKSGGVLTLWTARGAARHAKMLDTDKAWDVFELLEENYFSRRPDPAEPVSPSPETPRLTTAKERNALTTLINRYVGMLPGDPNQEAYKAAWRKVHDVMGIKTIEELTVEQLPRAVLFMKSLVDAPALEGAEAKALPVATKPLSTIQDYASVFRGLPKDGNYWRDLSRRLVQAHDAFQKELEAIKLDAIRPFRENRRIEVATFLDFATTEPFKRMFEIAEDGGHTAYRGAYCALLGFEGLHDLLLRG